MSKSQISFVETQGFTINFSPVGAPVAIRTEADEIVVIVRLTLRPRDNVMNVDLDVTASGDGASMPRLDENATPNISGYWSTVVNHSGEKVP